MAVTRTFKTQSGALANAIPSPRQLFAVKLYLFGQLVRSFCKPRFCIWSDGYEIPVKLKMWCKVVNLFIWVWSPSCYFGFYMKQCWNSSCFWSPGEEDYEEFLFRRNSLATVQGCQWGLHGDQINIYIRVCVCVGGEGVAYFVRFLWCSTASHLQPMMELVPPLGQMFWTCLYLQLFGVFTPFSKYNRNLL
jgi:hypothetical protein